MSSHPNDPFMLPDPLDSVPGGTRLESVDEIRQAVQSRRKATESEPQPDADTLDFRPVRRPPMAMLCLLDDGRGEGEWIRLRKDVTVIGRSEGDVVIPHDASMSGRHVAIARHADKGRFRWHVSDLESTN